MEAWSKKGDRYEHDELQPGGFLPYQTLQPKETAADALASLEVAASSQDPTFVPLKVAEEIASGFTRGGEEQGPATDTYVSSKGRIPVFAGQDLSAEVMKVIQAIVRDNGPPRLFADNSATSSWELTGTEVREVPQARTGVIMSESLPIPDHAERGNEGEIPAANAGRCSARPLAAGTTRPERCKNRTLLLRRPTGNDASGISRPQRLLLPDV